jgi:hypothetical protein
MYHKVIFLEHFLYCGPSTNYLNTSFSQDYIIAVSDDVLKTALAGDVKVRVLERNLTLEEARKVNIR